MINEHKQTICEGCSIILNDNVTIVQGYLEADPAGIFKYESTDPNNDVPGFGVIRNRVQDENERSLVMRTVSGLTIPGIRMPKKKRHFCGVLCLVRVFEGEAQEKKRKGRKK